MNNHLSGEGKWTIQLCGDCGQPLKFVPGRGECLHMNRFAGEKIEVVKASKLQAAEGLLREARGELTSAADWIDVDAPYSTSADEGKASEIRDFLARIDSHLKGSDG